MNGLQNIRSVSDTIRAAKAQYVMIWLLVLKAALDFAYGIVTDPRSGFPQLVFWVAYLAVGIALLAFMFQLVRLLYGVGPAVVCAAVSFIPCFGTLTVLAVHGFALDSFRKRGVRVGAMGASAQQLRELVQGENELVDSNTPKNKVLQAPLSAGILRICPACGKWFALQLKHTRPDPVVKEVATYQCKACGGQVDFAKERPRGSL